MDVRLRFPELLTDRGYTAYRLAKESGGDISTSTAYRLTKSQGEVEYVEMKALRAICRVLGVTPNEVFTDDPPPAKPPRKRTRAK